jgi:ribosomal protein S18 acetylase RimI-like enzyme
MFRTLTRQEIEQVKPLLDRERNFIFYSNLQVRADRVRCLGDFSGDQVRAVGCYLTGLPFHAFSLHVTAAEAELYEVRELLNALKHELQLADHPNQTGCLTLAEEDAQRISLDRIQSAKTMLLMRLTDPTQLLPPQAAVRLDTSHLAEVNAFARQVGMIAFREDELAELPHAGFFEKEGLVSMAGFHIYADSYVEIGNIGTLPAQRGRGYARRVTSEICRLGLEKTPHVYLFVMEENAPAIAVYERLGFATVQRYRFLQFEL